MLTGVRLASARCFHPRFICFRYRFINLWERYGAPWTSKFSLCRSNPLPRACRHRSQCPSSLRTRGRSWRSSCRFLYNHNPFYIISALLVFSGLWQSFSREPALVEAGIIALGLAAYTLLLALTAWLVIRLGHVWEDARSILLVVVLMFLAISVSLDPVLNAEEQHGTSFVLAGFLFAVLVSEGVLRSLPLRLPALFRIPYYLVLALFFLYPLAMSPLLDHPPDASLYWALFGFSAAAGAVFLTLVPAVRRGPAYVADNGSPCAGRCTRGCCSACWAYASAYEPFTCACRFIRFWGPRASSARTSSCHS